MNMEENKPQSNSIRVAIQPELPPVQDDSRMNVTPRTSLLPGRDAFRQSPAVDVVQEGRQMIQQFLKQHTCYQLIKNSSKVVVFDVKIPVNLAFFALVEHDIKSAPLWDADKAAFVGMLTATDFVNILRHYYLRGSPMSELSEHSIATWRAVPQSISLIEPRETMVSISPEASLYEAVEALLQNRLHRVPILDPEQNSVLAIVTFRGILEYLVSSFREQRRLFDQTLQELGIGTYQNIITVSEDTPLIRVLHVLIEHRVSAVPILDANGTVINVYAVSDVTELAKEEAVGKLDLPVGEFLRMQAADGFKNEGLHVGSPDDTLHMLFEKFAALKSHRMVILDRMNRCVGVVSLCDLFQYFIDPNDQ